MGRNKVDVELKKISVLLESGNFSEASGKLKELTEDLESLSLNDAKKIVKFLDFYSKRIEQIKTRINQELINKLKIKNSYLK